MLSITTQQSRERFKYEFFKSSFYNILEINLLDITTF